ncbi:hypothetical protein [Deinococcus sonorensis]|uniref:Alpha/beta hydrolase n=2 Tax=Deinococcus sonorensis TaxID=309891 RepID=A0AAU7U4E1_9DEIO
MPIVFIHGVAIRESQAPEWDTLHHLTRGVHWPDIEAALRTLVAPALRPDAPESVRVSRVYWGDLGAHYTHGGLFQGSHLPAPRSGTALDLDDQALAEALEQRLLPDTPVHRWPETIATIWRTARDQHLRQMLLEVPVAEQWPLLEAVVQTRLHPQRPTGRRLPPVPFQRQRRRGLSRALSYVRRPLEGFVPIFLGDAMAYLNTRGTAASPGPIPRRVLAELQAAAHAGRARNEPLVVLTHSMGGQLLYDALSVFLPSNPAFRDVRVDFWCAVGSQLGLFKELSLTLEDQMGAAAPSTPSALPHLGYLWNVWSYSDLFSFRAEGVIPGAHDTLFPLSGNVQGDHLAYLHHPDFYRSLAAKIRALEPDV